MKPILFAFSLLLFVSQYVRAQGVGINEHNSAPAVSAMLDVHSTTKGILIPRMTTLQRNSIPVPANGLMVFDTDKSSFYVFRQGRWYPLQVGGANEISVQALHPVLSGAGETFGPAVAIDGNWAVISARDANSVYVDHVNVLEWVDGNWVHRARLVPSDPQTDDEFGRAVAIKGTTLIVGAPRKKINGVSRGAAYIFTRQGNSWTQQAKLVDPNGVAHEQFGEAVDTDGQTAVVGAPMRPVGGNGNFGGAAVFSIQNGAWTFRSALTPSVNTIHQFGSAVAVDGINILVGAPHTGEGRVFFYQLTGLFWTEKKVAAPNAFVDINAGFGRSVDIEGNRAVIGASEDDGDAGHSSSPAVYRAGAAYVYELSNGVWQQTEKLKARDRQPNDQFGHAVALSGGNLVIGASGKTMAGMPENGAVYIFRLQADGKFKFSRRIDQSGDQQVVHFGYRAGVSGNKALVGMYTYSSSNYAGFLSIE